MAGTQKDPAAEAVFDTEPAAPKEEPRKDAPKKAQRYQVTAALAICYVEDQGQVYVYKGGIIPQGTTPEHVKHLLESNIIAPVSE